MRYCEGLPRLRPLYYLLCNSLLHILTSLFNWNAYYYRSELVHQYTTTFILAVASISFDMLFINTLLLKDHWIVQTISIRDVFLNGVIIDRNIMYLFIFLIMYKTWYILLSLSIYCLCHILRDISFPYIWKSPKASPNRNKINEHGVS